METAIDLVIESKTRELIDDFKVRRVLPSAKRRMIGPFIFLDQMGPEIIKAGKGLDVAPHPHIGLATVTYLFQGELMHRDSIGSRQIICPGEVNWMSAGRGIAHSERTPPQQRKSGAEMFGIQTWVALPVEQEESEPTFSHYAANDLPIIEGEGKIVRLIAGSLYGKKSPVKTASELFYADAQIEKDAKLLISKEHEERGIYIVEGAIKILPNEEIFHAGQLLVLKPNEEITLTADSQNARIMLLGGEPFSEKRNIWWNFVSSSRDRIEQAKEDWKNQKFAPVIDETEFIPLPSFQSNPVVRYP